MRTSHACMPVLHAGSRDGYMMLWDARSPGHASTRSRIPGVPPPDAPAISPIWCKMAAQSPSAGAAAGPGRPSKAAKTSPPSITTVAFVPYSYLLVSSGSADTTVKIWDMRMQGLPVCDLEPAPAQQQQQQQQHASHKQPCGDGFAAGTFPHAVDGFACPTTSRCSAVGISNIATSPSGGQAGGQAGMHDAAHVARAPGGT